MLKIIKKNKINKINFEDEINNNMDQEFNLDKNEINIGKEKNEKKGYIR